MSLRLSNGVVVHQQLTDQKATPIHAASLLDKRFNTPDPRRCPVVLLVDEVLPLSFQTCHKYTIHSGVIHISTVI